MGKEFHGSWKFVNKKRVFKDTTTKNSNMCVCMPVHKKKMKNATQFHKKLANDL